MRKHGIVICLAVGAVVLTGCGGGGKKNAVASPTSSGQTTDEASPTRTDNGSAAPSTGAPSTMPSTAAPSAVPTYSGPTVGVGTKCGPITVVAGRIQCTHAQYVYQLYAQKKTAMGTAVFSGWECHKSTQIKGTVTCSRSGITLNAPTS